MPVMRKKKPFLGALKFTAWIIFCSVFLSACAEKKQEKTAQPKPIIYTVNYPLAYFAERIAGDQAQVIFPDIEGDPAYWQPSAEQVAGFQAADLIILNGASYAKWLSSTTLPASRMLDTSLSFEDKLIQIAGKKSHSHGPQGEHSHTGTAFTTWLDLRLAIEQAGAINQELRIENSGFEKLQRDLQELDQAWQEQFAKFAGQPLLGSHPVYQYLKRRYQLNLLSVHWEPDTLPKPHMWDELSTLLKKHPAKFMLWEAEPLAETKARLAELGIQPVVFDPSGNRPEKGDFLSVMESNLNNIKMLNK